MRLILKKLRRRREDGDPGALARAQRAWILAVRDARNDLSFQKSQCRI